MYSKGVNKTGLNSGETSWRSYSKSLIIELKEKLADRRARTLALLSENEDLAAFNEIDTESDGLEDTSTNLSNNEALPAKDEALQHGQVGDVNSLSDTSSLTGSDYNDVDIRHDGAKLSPGTSNCVNSRCCSRSCSTITSVSGRSYTSEDVSSRSLDDFVADANLADGIKERNHQCPHSVDVRCSLCLIETKIQETYFSGEVAVETEYQIVSQRRKRPHCSRKLSKCSLYCKRMDPPLFETYQCDIKAKSDTYLCVGPKSLAVNVDSHCANAGVLIVPALTEVYYPATGGHSRTPSSGMNSRSHRELEHHSKGSDQASDNVRTVSRDPGAGNSDSLQDYYLQVEEEDGDEDFLEDVASDEEEEVEAVSETDNVEVVSDGKKEVSNGNVTEVNLEGTAELTTENIEVDKQETWTDRSEEERIRLVHNELQLAEDDNYEEQHAEDENYEDQHAEDDNYVDQNAEDENYEEQHSEDENYEEQHAEDETYEEHHAEDENYEEKHAEDENYEVQHAGDDIHEVPQGQEVEGQSEVNKLIDNGTYTQDIECAPETELACDDILEGSAIITVEDEQIALSKDSNLCDSEFPIKYDTPRDQAYTSLGLQETERRPFSHMKTTLNELVRIFESNGEFYNAVNKSIVNRFENHYADFNMLFSAYENKSGNSGYEQMNKSASGGPDPQAEGSSSGPADATAKLNDQNRSLQVCLEKARLAKTLQGKVGHMRSMATNVATIKAYEQTIADLEKTMMDYLHVYAKEALGSVSDNLSKPQQTSSRPNGNAHDAAEENKGNTLHRSGTFVLKETCAGKPPNIVKRRDASLFTAMVLPAKQKTFDKDVEEEGDASKSEESQNVPHPSPTFLVSEDNKNIFDSFLEIPEHSKTNRLVVDSGMNRKLKKPQQTMKGPGCLISDQDFDSDTSDSLSEAKETGNLTYTSSLLTKLLDYNSADESKAIKDEAKLDEELEFAGIGFENNLAASSYFLDSSPGNVKQQRASTSKISRNVRGNPISKKSVALNALTNSRWMSSNDDSDNVEAFDHKTDSDKDAKNVDTPYVCIISESLKDASSDIPFQESASHVQPEARAESSCACSMRDLADINVLSRVPDSSRSNAGAISKVVTGSSRHGATSLKESLPTAVDKHVNKQAKSLLENDVDEDIANQMSCSKANETFAAGKPLSGRPPKQYFLGQQSHKQWQLPKEDTASVAGTPKQDMLLAKLDWSSSDDEAIDDVPRDVSPSNLLRQKQKRDVDDQLEHLSQYYTRSRKSRSPLRRATSANISRWIDDVQGASSECVHSETPYFFADSYPLSFRQNNYDALTGHTDGDVCTSKYYNIHEDNDNVVFVSPSQLLEARNQEEKDVAEESEVNNKPKEQTQNTDIFLTSTTFKEDQIETHSHEAESKRSWSVSSTSDEYVLSDTRSIQVNTSRDNLICMGPEDTEAMPDIINDEPGHTQANNVLHASYVEACIPKASLAIYDSSSAARINQSNTDITEGGFKAHQAVDNKSLYPIDTVSLSNGKDGSLVGQTVVEFPPPTDFTALESNNKDLTQQYNSGTCTVQTSREAGIRSTVLADPTGDGVSNAVPHNHRSNQSQEPATSLKNPENQQSVGFSSGSGSGSVCAEISTSVTASKDEHQMESVSAEPAATMQTSQTWTLGKELNKRMRHNGRSYYDSKQGEISWEGRTDVSAIRERWKLLEDGGTVDACSEPDRKQHSKKRIHHFTDQTAGFSITKQSHHENVASHSAGKNILPAVQEKDEMFSLPETFSPFTTIDEVERSKRQGGEMLIEYQAIDALRYKVNRLEQMLKQSDINTAIFQQRHIRVRAEETMDTPEKIPSCPHCQNSGSGYNLNHTQFQPPPEHGRESRPCCLDYANDCQYVQQTKSWNVCQLCLSSHGSCVHLQGGPLCLDKKFPKQCNNKSSKGCQTSDDVTPDNRRRETDARVDAFTQCCPPEVLPDAAIISLEQRVATISEDTQEMKHFVSSANTLLMEIDERMKGFAALTSTTLATHSRQLSDSQVFISDELKHTQESLHDQTDMCKLVREYVTVAGKNSETVLEEVRAQHQEMVARTAQTVEEAISPVRESLLTQTKAFEDIKSSLESVMSRLNDKRPEPGKKGMNYELMKERIVELTSQRDSEKVFHRITRQALRALEKDHDRLRQEYVRATCRRYNTNESEAQKRLWYYLNNEDKCPHNKNHSNVRATGHPHEVWSPRGSSTDGDASSVCSRHGSCPDAHMCEAECFRLPQCAHTVADSRKEWEFTSRRKDSTAMFKKTTNVKCTSKAGTYLARSVNSRGSGELFDRRNVAVIHVMKSPKKGKDKQTSRFVEQDLGVVSTPRELSVRLPQSSRDETCMDASSSTPTTDEDQLPDKDADMFSEDTGCQCSCPCRKNISQAK